MTRVNLGIAGAGGLRATNLDGFANDDRVEIYAVCDVREDALADARDRWDAEERYLDYSELLADPGLDAVYLCTPDAAHAEQAARALDRGVHVVSEVPAATSFPDARALVEAFDASEAKYMMNDETIYYHGPAVVNELVEAGLFGDPYYAEGEYLHRLATWPYDDEHATPWRRTQELGKNGATYTTHALAPILLNWMAGDRIERVCCVGSGHHYTDPDGEEFAQEDTTAFFGKTDRGRLIRIRQDFVSKRPTSGPGGRWQNYQLQGTTGCYEGARSPLDADKVWLEDRCDDETWLELSELEEEFAPAYLRDAPEEALRSGHGGTDYFVRQDFVEHVVNDRPATVGLHDAMDLTLPGLASERSIDSGSEWVDVPDSRAW